MERYDLVVIGSGPAGQRAAVQAAKLGRRVALVERRQVVGGVCIHTGTIPSKTLREAILYLTGYAQHTVYGASYAVKQNIEAGDLKVRVDHVIQREIDVVLSQLRRNGVEVIHGQAAFAGPHEVAVSGPQYDGTLHGEVIVLAVGTTPAPPSGIDCDDRVLVDSDGFVRLSRIPKTATVVGAGIIGVEYGSMLAALGVPVTLIDKRERLLDFVDREIADNLAYQLREKNMSIRLGEEVSRILREDGRAVTELSSGKRIVSDLALFSVGRLGDTAALNLPAAGLEADARGRLAVDAFFRTRVPHIYAVGDVIGFPSLASTSMEQGRLASCHAFGKDPSPMSPLLPFGIYSIPEISFIGPTEEELTRVAVPYEVGISRYRELARGQILGDDTGLLKLLFHRETRKLLAAHAIGTGATELIHIGQAAIALGGTLDYFIDTVFNYPTLAEGYKVAALNCANKLS
ncbi:MAG: Si-specific NAD(P)(+) transhydrogenase [Deltaproteobacteria bacterium]|nr:Si-specific NAD(P)(+) transhydrogenase [Deltaproteobacteria bacterium]